MRPKQIKENLCNVNNANDWWTARSDLVLDAGAVIKAPASVASYNPAAAAQILQRPSLVHLDVPLCSS